MTKLVEQGVAEGIFAAPHPREAARAVSTLCLGVSQWYRADGSMSVPELVDVYLEICKDAVRFVR